MFKKTRAGFWFMLMGLLLALLGLIRAEPLLVLEKGINLCLQCMGLS